MCYNNIMKNSLSKALKYIKAQVPSLHHLLPLPTVTTPHMSVQCKKKRTDTCVIRRRSLTSIYKAAYDLFNLT